MKKRLCVFLSIVFIYSLFAVNTSANNTLKGDIDGNGVLSLNDSYLIFDAISNKDQYDEKMDIDGNNRLSAADYRKASMIVIDGKTMQTADVYDMCERPLFHSPATLDKTIPEEYSDKISISETVNDNSSGVNHLYTVKTNDKYSLNNLVVIITFPENSVNCESDIYFDYKSNDIVAFDYEWLDGQLLVGMVFAKEKENGNTLFTFSRVAEAGMKYESPAFEVLEYNSYLNGNACFHSGGTATCIESKICDYCDKSYGFKSDHIGGKASCDKQAVCELCGVSYGALVEHAGGIATCSQKPVCEVCGQSYGAKLPHQNFDFSGNCDVCGDDFAADNSGVNTSVLIFNDYLLYTIYFTDVESVRDVSFELEYDIDVFFDSECDYFGDFIKADVNCIPGAPYVYKCDFTTTDGYKIDKEMPILISFALYYRQPELFSYDGIP